MVTSFILFLNIVAGTSFEIWIGFNPSNYTASTHIEQQQNVGVSLNTLLISLVVVATVITIASAFLQRQNKFVFYSLLLDAVFPASRIVISRLGNLPIQIEMLTWNSASFPENWTAIRDLTT